MKVEKKVRLSQKDVNIAFDDVNCGTSVSKSVREYSK